MEHEEPSANRMGGTKKDIEPWISKVWNMYRKEVEKRKREA